ncbi:MAG: hypothetical protein EOP88_05925 [Verrucomicrobiaceae bacterium]|nr:MAG: hypothetical protein EOP88_05925 [Verrucomicrobiaceae bacterium]
MKYRPSKRVVWLAVPFVLVVLMFGLLWYAGQPDSEAIATRGAKPPPDKRFSLANPGSWGVSAGWLGDGMDALMEWEHNPWKDEWKRDRSFGKRLSELERSDRPEDKAELERLKKLGREWYERILSRYPELAMQPDKEIPRAENGFLQWQELLKRVKESGKDGIFDTALSQDLVDHLRKNTEPDMAAVNSWLEANRARIDEIRAIGLLSGQSSAGMTEDERVQGSIQWTRSASKALMLDARAAVAAGDMERALESIRAVNGLAEHLSGTRASSLMGTMVAATMRSQMQEYVLNQLLPSAPAGSADLAAWQSALDLKMRPPSEVANGLRAEWNEAMPRQLLPILSDSADPGTPRDGDYLAETYTRHMQALMQQAEVTSLRDYAASSRVETSTEQLSRRSRDLGLVNQWDPRGVFLRNQENTGLTQAAFAVMNGQPVPLDPVYGLPYKWDPVKRELGPPDPPNGRNYKLKPIKVPKM